MSTEVQDAYTDKLLQAAKPIEILQIFRTQVEELNIIWPFYGTAVPNDGGFKTENFKLTTSSEVQWMQVRFNFRELYTCFQFHRKKICEANV